MALKDEPIEFRREQYEEKNAILAANGEEVSARTLYEDIFSDIDIRMPIVIIDEDEEQKHIKKMTLDEALEASKDRSDMLLGGTTYFNEFVSKGTAKNIHAFIIDMDNVYAGTLQQAFLSDWARANGEPVPMPTYIVNSGTGLHLYFLLDRPLPHFKRQATQIDQLYRRLAKVETTGRNYLIFSRQWFGQDFRIAGGLGKDGWENTVFRVGEKWDADKLAAALGLHWTVKNEETGEEEEFKFEYEGDGKPRPRKKKKRSKHAIFRRTGYTLNERVYKSSLNRCKEETKEGTRYLSMCALAALAWKCRISEEQLRHDLLSLLPYYNKGAKRIVKPKEIESAIKMYNPKAMTTPRERSEDWLGWKFKETKRNGRKRWDHLQADKWIEIIKNDDGTETKRRRANICKENRELAIQDMIEAGELHGRPEGSGTKAQLVRDWRDAHPNGKKIDCERELHLSRHTVLKWWDEV